jgi:uncharacterized protein (TIGR03083 family)
MSLAGLEATEALAQQYRDVVESLAEDEWAQPSLCTGWRIQDLVAHTGSNWHVLVEPPIAETNDRVEPAPPMTAEQLQESLVDARRNWSADQVRGEWLAYVDGALGALKAMQTEPVASADMTLSDLGTYSCHLLADAFAFDLYCHLHVDLLAPTGPVSRSLPAITDDLLTPGIGWMLAGLPQMCPPVAAVLDRPLGLVLTGPGGGSWTLQPGTPFVAVESGLQDPAATVTSPATDFVIWGTKRSDWRPTSSVDGDKAYAATVLDAMNIV